MYCGLFFFINSTASELFLIFTTKLYQYFNVFFVFTLFSDRPEVFLPKYSQTAILHAAHYRRVVNGGTIGDNKVPHSGMTKAYNETLVIYCGTQGGEPTVRCNGFRWLSTSFK